MATVGTASKYGLGRHEGTSCDATRLRVKEPQRYGLGHQENTCWCSTNVRTGTPGCNSPKHILTVKKTLLNFLTTKLF